MIYFRFYLNKCLMLWALTSISVSLWLHNRNELNWGESTFQISCVQRFPLNECVWISLFCVLRS